MCVRLVGEQPVPTAIGLRGPLAEVDRPVGVGRLRPLERRAVNMTCSPRCDPRPVCFIDGFDQDGDAFVGGRGELIGERQTDGIS